MSVKQNVHNPETGRSFNFSTGETIVQVQQLFSIAGRHGAAANVVQAAAQVKQYTLQDPLCTQPRTAPTTHTTSSAR